MNNREPRGFQVIFSRDTACRPRLLGSIANLIVVEQARSFGIDITFRQHAAAEVPVTAISLGVLMLWMYF